LREGSTSELKDAHASKYVGIALEEIYNDILRIERRTETEYDDE